VYEAHTVHAFCLASFFPFLEIKKVHLTSQCWLCASVLSLFQVLSQLTVFLEACRSHCAITGDVVMLFVCLSGQQQQQQGGGARVRNNSRVIAAKWCQVIRYLKICVFYRGRSCLFVERNATYWEPRKFSSVFGLMAIMKAPSSLNKCVVYSSCVALNRLYFDMARSQVREISAHRVWNGFFVISYKHGEDAKLWGCFR